MAYLIASTAGAKCRYRNRREQLGRCRVVEGGHETTVALFGSDAPFEQQHQRDRATTREVAEHLRTGTSADTPKLETIAALASTLALTVKTARR